VIEYMPTKCEALSSTPTTTKKIKKKKEEEEVSALIKGPQIASCFPSSII
jgi:hypothetical protein